jgi:hypothetical protein
MPAWVVVLPLRGLEYQPASLAQVRLNEVIGHLTYGTVGQEVELRDLEAEFA